jgi:hypothetical protein
MIDYGVTHCPHCEKPYAHDLDAPDQAGLCYDRYSDAPCTTEAEKAAHLIAVLQARDALQMELERVRNG